MSENIYIVDNYDFDFNLEDLTTLLIDNQWKSFYVDSKTTRVDEDKKWLDSIREHIEINHKKYSFSYNYNKDIGKYIFTIK